MTDFLIWLDGYSVYLLTALLMTIGLYILIVHGNLIKN